MNTVSKSAQVDVLLGQPGDVNTLENPAKITTKKMTIEDVGTNFMHEFPAYSVR